jgi:hypothetical protein
MKRLFRDRDSNATATSSATSSTTRWCACRTSAETRAPPRARLAVDCLSSTVTGVRSATGIASSKPGMLSKVSCISTVMTYFPVNIILDKAPWMKLGAIIRICLAPWRGTLWSRRLSFERNTIRTSYRVVLMTNFNIAAKNSILYFC